MADGPETLLVRQMRKDGRDEYGHRLVTIKYHGDAMAEAGVSDILAVLDGVFIACEVKSPKSSKYKRATLEASIKCALDKGPTLKQRQFVTRAVHGTTGLRRACEQRALRVPRPQPPTVSGNGEVRDDRTSRDDDHHPLRRSQDRNRVQRHQTVGRAETHRVPGVASPSPSVDPTPLAGRAVGPVRGVLKDPDRTTAERSHGRSAESEEYMMSGDHL
jgi:hypothetical protein